MGYLILLGLCMNILAICIGQLIISLKFKVEDLELGKWHQSRFSMVDLFFFFRFVEIEKIYFF